MKINRLSVKNYRTLEDIKIEFVGFYTAISGRNNAGKTSLIKVLRHTFKDHSRDRFFDRDDDRSYQEDKTQWVSGSPDILFDYLISIDKDSDPGLFQFVQKFHNEPIVASAIELTLTLSQNSKDEISHICYVHSNRMDDFASKEIFQKLMTSNLAFVHDSAARDPNIFFGRSRALHEFIFSSVERNQILEEQKRLQQKVKKISRAHKTELSELLGHLEDKYEVEFTLPEGMFTGTLPFAINLKDRNVDVPLDDWGSGTKNRTHIMMSILQAHRIRSKDDQNRITPFVMIEEPESFLHPSAQAEFGRVLRTLANDLKIQTIVTTHSPYMLCQENVASNVLLVRKQVRGKFKATERIELRDDTWMEPFSEILGLDNSEFTAWKDILNTDKTYVLLVEGELDKKYIEHIQSMDQPSLKLPDGIDIVAYEGKDALKNTILLKFMQQKFRKVFVTFDLDAKPELEKIMAQIGLKEGVDYLALGVNKPGKQCIEGLVPDRILSVVHGKNTDLVMQLTAQDSKDRKSAKSALKQKILSAFQQDSAITFEEVKGFSVLFKAISTRMLSK